MLTMSARDRRGQRQEKEGCRGEDRSMFDVERGPCSLSHPDWKPQDGPEQVSFTVTSCVLPKADLLMMSWKHLSDCHGVIMEGELVGCKSVTKWARSSIPLEDTVDPTGPLTVPHCEASKEKRGDWVRLGKYSTSPKGKFSLLLCDSWRKAD